MKRLFSSLFPIAILLILTSCNCGQPIKIKSIQQGDKALTCKDVILEINEAEFFRKEAAIAQRITLEEAFTPTCWMSTYLSGSEAARAANERIQYLSQLYDILDCGGRSSAAAAGAPQAASPSYAPVPPPPASSNAQNAPVDPWMHVHVDQDARRYMHSHQHSGPHSH